MKKKESKQKQKEGLKLFLQGYPKYRIAKMLRVGEKTVRLWAKSQGWDESYDQLESEVISKIPEQVIAEKERSLKLIRGAEAIIAQKIQSGEIEGISISSLAQLQRAKWDILTPKQVNNQLNFVKQENKSTQINVVIPKEVQELIEQEDGI